MSHSDEQKFLNIKKSLGTKRSDFLMSAYELSKKAHYGQKRKSGEDYFIHPLSVGIALWNRFHDVDLFAAGLLHDAVEDCDDLDISEIYEKFGENVGYIVDSVTKTNATFYGEEEAYTNERDKMLAGGMKNIGCILVKLADRQHNLATLKYMPPEKQIKKSFESQSLYLPLMHILGFNEDGLSLEKCKGLFKKYVDENKLTTFKEIKSRLLNVCFEDFTEELFDIVYNNTSNVVWEMIDREAFNELVSIGWFDSTDVKILSLKGSTRDDFKVMFSIVQGNAFESLQNLKLKNGLFI